MKKDKDKINISFIGKVIPKRRNLKNKPLEKRKSDGLCLEPSDSPENFANDLLEEVGAEEELEKAILEKERIENEMEKLKKDGAVLSEAVITQKTGIPPLSSDNNIILTPKEIEFFKRCPKCNKKLKKSFVKKNGENYIQILKCKRKTCDFFKEIILKI